MFAFLPTLGLLFAASQPVRPDVPALTAAIEQNHQRFLALPGFSAVCTVRYDHRQGERRAQFSLIEVTTAAHQGKLFARSVATHEKGQDAGMKEDIQSAWDGKIGTELTAFYSKEGQRFAYTFDIRDHLSSRASYAQFYLDRLFFPEGSARSESPTILPGPPYGFDVVLGGPDYWLPDALKRNATHYRVLPTAETVDDAACVVLEWPQHDRIWLDPAMNHAIRRRDFRRHDGAMRDRVLLKDFSEIAGGLWLPRRATVEVYCGTTYDPPALLNQISGVYTVEVSDLAVETLPEEQFLLAIPDGARVHDMIRNVNYEVVTPGEAPRIIARAEAELTRRLSAGKSRLWLWMAGGAALLALAAFFGYRRLKAA